MTAVKMRNIGPKSAAWLRQVGLRSLEDLTAVGTVEAFMRVKRAGFKPGLTCFTRSKAHCSTATGRKCPRSGASNSSSPPMPPPRCCRRHATAPPPGR